MPFEVLISNQQRRATVDMDWLSAAAAKLSQAVLHNLTEHPIAEFSLSALQDLGQRGNLSLVLVSNQKMRLLNRQWRRKDATTDVLSFPLELEAPPAGLPWQIGEIVISLEKAIEQANLFGHSVEREIAFLFVHGCLHIFGFDHEEADEEKEMFGRQHAILMAAGISR